MTKTCLPDGWCARARASMPAAAVRTTVLAVPLLAALGLNGAHAASGSNLEGAWVQEPAKCEDVFASKNGRTVFRKGQALTLSGFIVEGKRIRGAAAACEVASAKDKGDTTSVLLNCSSQLMFSRVAVTLRVTGADTLQRIDTDFPDVAETYRRCPPR